MQVMSWWRRNRNVTKSPVRPEPYRELKQAEIDAACALGENGTQSMLAVHIARTMRDEEARSICNLVRNAELRGAPEVQQWTLAHEAIRMNAAVEFEERWKALFDEWTDRKNREQKKQA